jgi:hypothetical protein
MEIVFLPSSVAGLEWFRFYYSQVFPAGARNAIARYEKMKMALTATPQAGYPVGESDSREYVIPKTPFSVVYRVRGQQIQILLLIDNRSDRLAVE